MLRWRLISAAVVLSILLGFLHLDFHHYQLLGASGAWLVPITLIVAVLAVGEVLGLFAAKGWRPAAWAVYSGTLLVVLGGLAPVAWALAGQEYPADCPLGKLGWPLAAFGVAISLIFISEMFRYREPGEAVTGVVSGTFVVGYVGIPFAFLAALRLFHSHAWGMAALISVVVVVKISDTGAYFTGRALGRHKLAPLLSPKKTVEGAVGGLVAACLASLAYFFWIVPRLVGDTTFRPTVGGCLLFAVIVTVAGMVGDLAESVLKRDAGRKDSSTWLPGLGGVLDMLDSLLLAAAPAFLCWAAGLVGPGS